MNTRLLPKFILTASVAILTFAAAPLHAVQTTALVNNAGTQQLLNFDSATPGIVGSAVNITGLNVGETLTSIDYRPVDAILVGLGYTTANGTTRVLTISSGGVVTSIDTLALGAGLTRVVEDFNPTANALRITTNGLTANNLRVPTGGTGTLQTDTDLNPANPNIRATAYSRNSPGGGTNGATTLYEIDGTNGSLVSQGILDFPTGGAAASSPNAGTINQIAALTGVLVGVAGANTVVGFDIFNVLGTAATSAGSAFLATTSGAFDTLNLVAGANPVGFTANVGQIGGAFTNIVDIAVVPEPASIALLGVAAAGLVVRRNRRKTVAA